MARAGESHLPDVIGALRHASAYAHPAGDIELIQTHISCVLLAGQYAYKVKKPLSLGFLDYSTLERRRAMCEEEVRLNRRLCPEAYLGVVPIVRAGASYLVGGEGDAVEYAVQMRRMPHDRMMPALLAAGRVSADDVRRIARRIAEFHGSSETDGRIAAFGRAEAIRRNWEENFGQAAPFAGDTIDASALGEVRAYVDALLRTQRPLIELRADAGRVRDCHGDLRSDSVVLHEDGRICVMDCIEFNDRIRYGDVAGDVAFMAMDLEYRGRRDLADEFLGAYMGAALDETIGVMLPFYTCYRAFVRGKVESMESAEAEVPASEREAAAARARAYFALARRYAVARRDPLAVMMVGLSGSGKSHLARALAARTGAALVVSDAVRKELLGVAAGKRLDAAYGEGAYTAAERDRVYREMLGRATAHLAAGRRVVLDATHIARADRDRVSAVAHERGVPLLAVVVEASEDAVRRHFAARTEDAEQPSDARIDVYRAQRARYQPPDEVDARRTVRVDGAAPLATNVPLVLAAIS